MQSENNGTIPLVSSRQVATTGEAQRDLIAHTARPDVSIVNHINVTRTTIRGMIWFALRCLSALR